MFFKQLILDRTDVPAGVVFGILQAVAAKPLGMLGPHYPALPPAAIYEPYIRLLVGRKYNFVFELYHKTIIASSLQNPCLKHKRMMQDFLLHVCYPTGIAVKYGETIFSP